jgi:hypothetical protein
MQEHGIYKAAETVHLPAADLAEQARLSNFKGCNIKHTTVVIAVL